MLTVRDSQMQAMAQASGKPAVQPCPRDQSWIEVRLVDEDGNPISGEKYQLTMPDGSVREGTLGDDGRVRLDGIVPGQADIEFPNLHGKEWNPV